MSKLENSFLDWIDTPRIAMRDPASLRWKNGLGAIFKITSLYENNITAAYPGNR